MPHFLFRGVGKTLASIGLRACVAASIFVPASKPIRPTASLGADVG